MTHLLRTRNASVAVAPLTHTAAAAWARAFLSALLLSLAFATAATAQSVNRTAALVVLPPGHWSRAVARRVDAARLAPRGFDAYAPTLTLRDVGELLDAAAGRAEATDHPLQLQLLGWLDRLRNEYPNAYTESVPELGARAQLALGVTAHQNPLRPRAEGDVPRYDADTLSAFGLLRASANVGGRIDITADAVASHEGVQLREAFAAGLLGDVGLWAGRRRTGVMSSAGGGMVLHDAVAWDGGGLWLARPLRLPLLGALHFETLLAAADSNGTVAEPWFWLTRGTIEPLPRFTIGITRAILFGDTAGRRAIDWGEFAKILIGQNSIHARDATYADDQIVAVDGRWRTPLRALPVELYLTWGAEDSSGAWWQSPAIIGGVFVPALPGAPLLSLGIEHAVFSGARGHGHFYEHGFLTNGWAEDGRLIGHPLGGTGREWLLYGSFDHDVSGPAIQWRAWRRVRPPGNRLSPTRVGTAWGGMLHAQLDVFDHLRLHGAASIEAGDDWKTGAAAAYVEWHPATR